MRSEPAVNWTAGTLSDLVRLQRGHDLPEPKRRPGNVPVMGSAGLSGYHDEATVRGPGLVLGRSGASFGKVHYCEEDYWPLNTALFATDFLGNDPRFAYFVLKTIQFSAFNSGSAQPSLNRNFIANIPTAIPPIAEQRRIVQLLGGLDDRIDNKRRMVGALEALLSEEFSRRFVKSAGVGELWNESVLSDLVQQRGERCQASEITASLPYVPIDAISPYHLMLEDKRPGDQALSSLTMFEADDILFGAMRPYFHKVAIAPFRGVTRTTVFVLRPINEPDWAYVTMLLNQTDTIEYATRTARGSTIPYAVWDGVLSEMPVYIPPLEERAAFDRFAQPALRFIQNACFEQDTLAEIRDTLLPKLVSGEIRVPDTHDPKEVIGPAAAELAAATP